MQFHISFTLTYSQSIFLKAEFFPTLLVTTSNHSVLHIMELCYSHFKVHTADKFKFSMWRRVCLQLDDIYNSFQGNRIISVSFTRTYSYSIIPKDGKVSYTARYFFKFQKIEPNLTCTAQSLNLNKKKITHVCISIRTLSSYKLLKNKLLYLSNQFTPFSYK